ncbi:hypothetical protein RRG08_007286 [Elysia crispata]|uniref:Uncharacterized protein n=1 Tax=Elysia crispata TaxID=231223 RepID=A0AAE0ZKF7_9GAST|nr:hypothetical protein RRG08_007286 [Elysia crispata]
MSSSAWLGGREAETEREQIRGLAHSTDKPADWHTVQTNTQTGTQYRQTRRLAHSTDKPADWHTVQTNTQTGTQYRQTRRLAHSTDKHVHNFKFVHAFDLECLPHFSDLMLKEELFLLSVLIYLGRFFFL